MFRNELPFYRRFHGGIQQMYYTGKHPIVARPRRPARPRAVPPPAPPTSPRPRHMRRRRRQAKEHRRARAVCEDATKLFRHSHAGAVQPPRPTTPPLHAQHIRWRHAAAPRPAPRPRPPRTHRLHARNRERRAGQRAATHGSGETQPRREGGHEESLDKRRAPATRDGGAAAHVGPRCSAVNARSTAAGCASHINNDDEMTMFGRRCEKFAARDQPKTHVVRPVHRAAPDASPPAAIAARRALSSFWQSFLCAPQSSL